ncbi:tRNA-dihydrouridine synthase 2 isoform 2 [Galdieria sulphuraria]|uniref:tRNA-dihydrouridine synthase n=1 Tax=Galdieria sulphuraria TaxID=130081 RepID=M2Y6G4_GALSU|nr:tRNA-dihydrouridine synthase 2 isoform 2 [Galdieria sulphuraria]EME31439.1 tRNA-dihydrouridine synthase 2 isoform 2 [Galdieria sulphuraria]|eukprot:XP_005707959.1 tRNA-dihydrouridine synthase 2 isoform 2 [Galdieria sulphuraria]
MDDSSSQKVKKVLAPMVRVGTLPMRLLALEYGADLVYSEEIIDRNFLDCYIHNNEKYSIKEWISNKTQLCFFSTCNQERDHLIVQLGTSNGNCAWKAAEKIIPFCRGIDVNMGCPLLYSTKGGMGSALLKTPEIASDIIKTLRRNLPNEYSVTAKIRLFPVLQDTIDFVHMLANSGVDAVAIHARQVHERAKDKANWSQLAQIASHVVNVPLLGNGDIFSLQDMQRMKDQTGISQWMIARMAQWNVSVFQGTLDCINNVILRYAKLAEETNTYYGLAKYCIQQMIKYQKWTRTEFASKVSISK